MSHQRARARVAGLAAAAIASTAVFAAGPSAAEPAGGQAPAPEGPTGARTVTLVTGDVVTLGGPRGVEFTPASGRERVGFRTHTDVEGDVHVIPDDALAGVSSGRLDPRLFDVSELARTGYGDADREDLPLIVDYPGAAPKAAGAKAFRELPSMSATALRATKDARFWADARTATSKIWLDGPVRATLDQSVAQIGAPSAWGRGLTGSGATVAVLDTGIDVTHPDLTDAVVGAKDFTGSETGTDDHFGHGTHVASIVTGAGARYKGVAPDAKLLNGKVLNDHGEGYESGTIAGMEWAAASGADVVNLSLGGGPTDGTDPMSAALNRLTAETGTLFVVAAGNDGPKAETVSTPGAADAALTVGAVDRADQLAEFSSRGPRWQNGAIKPDITAPGVGIVAAAAANGVIGNPVEDGYVALDGTSMATPHVAGAAAILAAAHPDWTPERVKSTFMATAKPNQGLSVFEQGAGRVDVAAAVTNPVTVSPANLFLGVVAWPHDDDQPISKTVTYTNSGAEPVTFDLSADVRGPGGAPAPAGMFVLSADRVVVPAGGTAQVTLTADTRIDTEDGVYSGAVVATAGDTTVRSLVAVNREAEVYEVTFDLVDHQGAPSDNYGVLIVDLNARKEYAPYDPSGTVTLRLPKGEYFVNATVITEPGEWEIQLTDFFEPRLVVDGPAELDLDARDGISPHFVVDEPTAKQTSAFVHYTVDTAWGQIRSYGIVSKYNSYGIKPSTTSAPGVFTLIFDAHLAKPNDAVWLGFHQSPYQYSLRETIDGAVPTDQEFRVTNDELATVRSSHAVATPGKIGVRDSFISMTLPHSMTEYYTPDTEWFPYFYESEQDEPIFLTGTYGNTVTPVSYRRGTTTEERWNVGVFGPALPLKGEDPSQFYTDLWTSYLARQGDQLFAYIPLRTDQNLGRDSLLPFPDDGVTELLRDGEVVASSEWAGFVDTTLPPEKATYTLRTTALAAPGAGPLSDEITAEWTFTSGHTAADSPTLVPAMALRFAPSLDDHNTAPTGRFRIPLHVQRNGAETPGRFAAPTVEVSYDHGATWRKARVSEGRNGWVAEVDHPRGAEFVSLRSSVADRHGNVAKQTILNAYALRG